MEHNTFPSWPDVAPHLIETAAGRVPAELVIRGGIWANVHTREALPDHDIAITHGRIACVVPDASHCIGPEKKNKRHCKGEISGLVLLCFPARLFACLFICVFVVGFVRLLVI